MDNTRSTEAICCQGERCEESQLTTKQVILSWDKFNARVWLLFILSFVVWAIAFFIAYKPGPIHGGMNHGGMDHGGMDHGEMDHGEMDHGGMDHGGMDHHGGMNHSGMHHTGM
uniref:Uncharacterized protein n=1 Tax=Bracon brevicornis TaxID=1563983 RepID=A0A6V7LDR3_9HYME